MAVEHDFALPGYLWIVVVRAWRGRKLLTDCWALNAGLRPQLGSINAFIFGYGTGALRCVQLATPTLQCRTEGVEEY